MMRWAAMAIVCRPLEQKRLTVRPATDTGRPARRAAWRAMLAPVAPSGFAQPISTSSTSAPSMPARSMAALTAWPPSSAPCVMLKAPFQLLASGVRAVETMTASVMGKLLESRPGTATGSGMDRVESHAQVGRGFTLDGGRRRVVGLLHQLAPRARARDDRHAQHHADQDGQGALEEARHRRAQL